MQQFNVYEDIASRTGGDVYIGVVGPVRTGKSTFIKRFMEKLVVPFADPSVKGRMTDELPQSATGKTVMTTEPKFVPNEAVEICVSDGAKASVRLVDCVGFPVDGANGFTEGDAPRMVKTPWQDTEMPFAEAAELGTKKVICDHSTIGVLVTTDGSITDIPRENYVEAEERTVRELKAIGKPFVILLNCVDPKACNNLKETLESKYGVPVLAMDALRMDEDAFAFLLQSVLFEFPLCSVDICIPAWVQTLPADDALIQNLIQKVQENAPKMEKMKHCFSLETLFSDEEKFRNPDTVKMDLGKGKASVEVGVKSGVFYDVLSGICGREVRDEKDLISHLKTLAEEGREYGEIKDAFRDAKRCGYGVAPPKEQNVQLSEPKLIRRGSGYGVRFNVGAESYHVLRVDVRGDVSPIVGLKDQGEAFLRTTQESRERGEEEVWQTNIFGRTLRELAMEVLRAKNDFVPSDVKKKMRRTMTRIVNEGKGGVFCILL